MTWKRHLFACNMKSFCHKTLTLVTQPPGANGQGFHFRVFYPILG